MRTFTSLFCLLYLCVLAASEEVNNCLELGFTGEQSCSDCDSLAEYVKDQELVDDCKKCCTPDRAVNKFDKAVLEVCDFRLNGFQQVKEFISKKASEYSNLKISYVYGASPKLKLYHSEGTESIRIDNWKMSHINEFLEERLVKPALH